MTTSTVERKKLLKRLTGFLAIVGDDVETLDPALVARIDRTIQALKTPARIVIAGLSDANHHALVSTLAGTVLVTGENAAACPSLLVKAGADARTATQVGGRDRVFKGCVVDTLIAARAQEAITVSLPTLAMPHVEMSILPVYDSHDDRSGYLLSLLEDSDLVIWCSDAGAAWQPRERRLWFTVPDDVKGRSVLALTGAERIDSDDAAREAHDEKCEIVAGDFAQTLSIAAGQTDALVAALSETIDGDLLAAARALRTELSTIPIGTVTAATAPLPPVPSLPSADAPEMAQPAAETGGEEDARDLIVRHATHCMEIAATDTDDFGPLFEAMSALLEDLTGALRGGERLDRDHDAMLAQIGEAGDLIGLLGYEGTAPAARESADLLRQIALDTLDRLPVAEAAQDIREAC